MNHIFLIHSSVDGHLCYFHVSATVNGVAMNIGVHVSFQIMFSSRYMPRSGTVRSYGSSIFLFFFLKETPLLFSLVIVPIYILTNSVGRFQLVIVFKPPFCSKEKFEESNKSPLEEV